MKHTPGPWELSDENNAHFEIQIGETICSLDRCSRYSDLKYVIEREEMIANGHLIMAAPDMLDALKELRAHFTAAGWNSNDSGVIRIIDSAIKKATGE